MEHGRRVFLAGHKGMVGQALNRILKRCDEVEVIRSPRASLDLRNQSAVERFFQREKLDAVILAAARVGGIWVNNSQPADFIYDNLMIQANVIHQAFKAGVPRLLQLGSSCIYPRGAPQPISEAALLSGPLEATNEPYAIAKIAGIKLCESYNRQYGTDYRSVMPTNLYGPGDNFHPENSHVLPALLRRFHEAVESNEESVTIWGSGSPRREFLHVDDMAEASLFVLGLDKKVYEANTEPMLSHINVGSGAEISILDVAQLIAKVTRFDGEILTDPSKPDGTPRKLMDVSRLANMGWQAQVDLKDGLEATYRWYLDNQDSFRR